MFVALGIIKSTATDACAEEKEGQNFMFETSQIVLV